MSKRYPAVVLVVFLCLIAVPSFAAPPRNEPEFRDREPRIIKIVKKVVRSFSYGLTDPKP